MNVKYDLKNKKAFEHTCSAYTMSLVGAFFASNQTNGTLTPLVHPL